MSGYYQQNSQLPGYYDPNIGPPVIDPEGYIRTLQPMQPLSNEQLRHSYLDYEEDPRAIAPAQGSARARRRTVAGGEHVKHRRTRSGCYTCRNRRVKVHLFLLSEW